VVPVLALGVYAACISYGYRFIGAAAGTFVFYATVMLTLIASDVLGRTPVPPRRWLGARSRCSASRCSREAASSS
jgi:drug/metabolite transporter (DMT)-like permease